VPIFDLLEERAFDAAQTARLAAAFDVAWQILKTSAPELDQDALKTTSREVLAKLIIDEGAHGEDTTKIIDNAVARFRKQK
jgi:hypothetical protein